MSHFLEKETDVQLFLALAPALMIFFHHLPLQECIELRQDVESDVPEEHQEVEIFRAKRAIVVLLENSVSQLKLIAVFTIKLEKGEQEDDGPEKSSDVGKGLVKFLMGPGDVVTTSTFSEVELEVGVAGVDNIVVVDCGFNCFEAGNILVFLPGED